MSVQLLCFNTLGPHAVLSQSLKGVSGQAAAFRQKHLKKEGLVLTSPSPPQRLSETGQGKGREVGRDVACESVYCTENMHTM